MLVHQPIDLCACWDGRQVPWKVPQEKLVGTIAVKITGCYAVTPEDDPPTSVRVLPVGAEKAASQVAYDVQRLQ